MEEICTCGEKCLGDFCPMTNSQCFEQTVLDPSSARQSCFSNLLPELDNIETASSCADRVSIVNRSSCAPAQDPRYSCVLQDETCFSTSPPEQKQEKKEFDQKSINSNRSAKKEEQLPKNKISPDQKSILSNGSAKKNQANNNSAKNNQADNNSIKNNSTKNNQEANNSAKNNQNGTDLANKEIQPYANEYCCDKENGNASNKPAQLKEENIESINEVCDNGTEDMTEIDTNFDKCTLLEEVKRASLQKEQEFFSDTDLLKKLKDMQGQGN